MTLTFFCFTAILSQALPVKVSTSRVTVTASRRWRYLQAGVGEDREARWGRWRKAGEARLLCQSPPPPPCSCRHRGSTLDSLAPHRPPWLRPAFLQPPSAPPPASLPHRLCRMETRVCTCCKPFESLSSLKLPACWDECFGPLVRPWGRETLTSPLTLKAAEIRIAKEEDSGHIYVLASAAW